MHEGPPSRRGLTMTLALLPAVTRAPLQAPTRLAAGLRETRGIGEIAVITSGASDAQADAQDLATSLGPDRWAALAREFADPRGSGEPLLRMEAEIGRQPCGHHDRRACRGRYGERRPLLSPACCGIC